MMIGVLHHGHKRYPVTLTQANQLVASGRAAWKRQDIVQLHPAARLPFWTTGALKPGWPLPKGVTLRLTSQALAEFRASLGRPVGLQEAHRKVVRLMTNTGRELGRQGNRMVYQTSQNLCFAVEGMLIQHIWQPGERLEACPINPKWFPSPGAKG